MGGGGEVLGLSSSSIEENSEALFLWLLGQTTPPFFVSHEKLVSEEDGSASSVLDGINPGLLLPVLLLLMCSWARRRRSSW